MPWDTFLSKKPIPGKNHPDDEKLLAEARECIGDYKLKEDLSYKPPPHLRETTVKKYKQVLDARLKQYDLRHNFIQKVWDIRDLKYVVRDRLINLRNKLLTLNEDLPESMHKFGPNIPEIRKEEFPEEKLKEVIILPVDEDTELVDHHTQEFVEKPDHHNVQCQLLPKRSYFPKFSNGKFVSPLSAGEIEQVLSSDFDNLLEFSEEIDTPMEMNLRVKWLNRHVYKLDQTVSKMEKEIENFNNTIEETKKERLPIHVGGNFIDIYILTLNQELNILKNFEDGEDQLTQKVMDNLKLVHKLEDEIDMLKNKKEENEVIIENFHTNENKIQDKFKHAAENNKYYDFLKKVFRKKFKPPKQATDEESSSESSSSSSEESDFDDSASIDSRDFGVMKQDLNVCPKGCELAIFNLTVELRSKRHEIEQSIREQTRILDTVKKDIEMGSRRLNVLQNQLQTSQMELESYQREKQILMNQVSCTVVLTLDQTYNYNPEYDEISKYVVFSKSTLSDLYKRVGVLQSENLQQSTKYESYHKHLTRMKKDLRYMEGKIKDLKMYMQKSMLEKFGKLVDIDEITMAIIQRTFHKSHVDEMEEIVLKSRVYDIRMKNTDIKSMYIAELTHWNSKISNALGELAEVIKENTKRLDLLHVMNKEKKELVKIITMQPKRIEQIDKILETHSHYLKEIKKLQKIIEDQCSQLQDLKVEIKMLKTKGLPPKTEIKAEFESTLMKKREVVEKGTKEWIDYDKYIEREDDIFPEKRVQEIDIPGLL
nr:centrosomal protein of 290 kDa-like [Leptinotarsa decemlineata]